MILGIDYGTKRIGIAAGDRSVKMAFARETIAGAGSVDADATVVAHYFRNEGFESAVIGLPLLESGDEGEQAQMSREFGKALSALGVQVEFFDERYTTGAAKRLLGHLSPGKQKEVLDSEAARIMLQEYLEQTTP